MAPAPSFAEHPTDQEILLDGSSYAIRDGVLYRRSLLGGDRYVLDLFDPEHLTRTYFADGDRIRIRHPETGQTFEVLRHHRTVFDQGQTLLDMMGYEQGWTNFTLKSNSVPTVADYVALMKGIMAGTEGFRENAIRPVPGALRFEAARATRRTGVSKASIDGGLYYATNGDRVTFTGQFRIVEGMPVSLMDFEASYINEGPGLRVMLSEDGAPRVELKWLDKPSWRPTADVTVPIGEWFEISVEAVLRPHDGRVILRLDGDVIAQGRGPTLPFDWAVYDRIEVGVTATVDSSVVLDVAEFSFSAQPDG